MALRHIDFLVGVSVSSRRGHSKYVDKRLCCIHHVLYVSEEFFLVLLLTCTPLSCELILTVIQPRDEILTAPASVLRTAQTVPKSISKPIGTITVNGLLATELAMDTSEVRAPWRAVLPTNDDFEESMPVMWHPSLQALLPPASLSLLENQKKKNLLRLDRRLHCLSHSLLQSLPL